MDKDIIIPAQGLLFAGAAWFYDALPALILIGSFIIIVLRILQQIYDFHKSRKDE